MKNFFIIIILVVGGVILMFMYYLGYIPVSSLKQEIQERTQVEILEICNSRHVRYPGPDWPFPFVSSDGRYYADFRKSQFRRAEVLEIYQSNTRQRIGTYSYFRLNIYCWAPDSSGIYVADYVPGSSGFFSFYDTPGRTGPVKKLLVP